MFSVGFRGWSDVEEGGAGADGGLQGQSRTQMLLEEEQSIEQLQERERAIRQLEVGLCYMS